MNGRTEVIDADLSKYFDTLAHRELLRRVARRVSDGSALKLIKQWLRAPVVEEDENGRKRILPNSRGTPQGGVISPLLANLSLNALDWAVNEKVPTKPRLIRYADDFVILCRPGPGGPLRARLGKWVQARGLKLNEEKTRLVDSRQEAFHFLGFTVRWQKSWRSGRACVHGEPSAKSRKKFHEQLRSRFNHWTLGRRVTETMSEFNRYLRGWSQYFHYAHGARVISKLQWWTRHRVRRWLWRKHKMKKALWSDYPDGLLHGRYGLWRMPTHPAWKAKTT